MNYPLAHHLKVLGGQAANTLKKLRTWFFAGLVWTVGVLGTGLANAQTPGRFADDMAERTRACTACHGDQGRAGPDGYYPRLAGKPAGSSSSWTGSMVGLLHRALESNQSTPERPAKAINDGNDS